MIGECRRFVESSLSFCSNGGQRQNKKSKGDHPAVDSNLEMITVEFTSHFRRLNSCGFLFLFI